MIRFTVQTADFNEAAHIGGPVITSLETFVVDAPELEAHLREFERDREDAKKTKCPTWWNRQLVGFEIIPD